MASVAIWAEDLGKQYRIGARERRHTTLRDALAEAVRGGRSALVNCLHGRWKDTPELIWAVRNVSFEIEEGEVVGIIGRNGAGKSTLLKLLSRITEPTEGCAEITGRLGSLLEVGTGFHPELTGRENIYLNGAILGMSRAEISRRFDEIVAFSEIDRFLDTPVKRYSSGMYLRLAFAVAAHLEPEVLLVDEVLAVGDLQFQKKCLGKMHDVAQTGRTVLFVSHQMNQIRRLCSRCIWVDEGRIRKSGPAPAVVAAYEAAAAGNDLSVAGNADPRRAAQFFDWAIPGSAEDEHTLTTTREFEVTFRLRVDRPLRNVHHGISLFSTDNQLMWGTAADRINLDSGLWHFRYRLLGLPLKPGTYYWMLSLHGENGLIDLWHGVPGMIVATAPLGHPDDRWQGILNLEYDFGIV